MLIKVAGNNPVFHQYGLCLLLCLLPLAMSACTSAGQLPASPSPTAPPPLSSIVAEVSAEISAEELPTLVVTEREASIAGDLPLLTTLWAEDGRIVDGRGSSQENDGLIWQGRAAILDRYQLAVFPAPPPPLTLTELADATLTVEGDNATLINGGDRWRFVLKEGRWWLQELVYNAPDN